MADLSAQSLVMAVQAVDAESRRIKDSVGGEITELAPDDQELLQAFSRAAMELKAAYLDAREFATNMPPYDQLVGGG